jgi:gluconolactonase
VDSIDRVAVLRVSIANTMNVPEGGTWRKRWIMQATKLLDGLAHPEGPSILDDGRVVFCVCEDGTLGYWSANGDSGLYSNVGGGPNATVLGENGILYVANNGGAVGTFRTDDFDGGYIQRVDPSGKAEIIVREAGGRRLNMPNDLVFGPDGRLYFTDPGAWSLDNEADQDEGYIMVLNSDGTGEVLAEVGKTYPNGIAAEADGGIVWVESYSKKVKRWRPNGTIEEIITLKTTELPDGLSVAENGDLYITTTWSGGLNIVSPDGSRSEFVDLGTVLSNIVFDGSTLYLTDLGSAPVVPTEAGAYGLLWQAEATVRGMPMFRGAIQPTAF